MERTTNIESVKEIFENNFIGLKELTSISKHVKICVDMLEPPIPYSIDQLIKFRDTHLLILGVSWMQNGKPVTIKSLRDHFGIDPYLSEPCFYNQDWYLNEEFINYQLANKWFLISKNIIDESKGESHRILIQKYKFPSAILCAYSFFVCWFYLSEPLWRNDYIWCKDIDHLGDQIYVGQYFDITKTNKNGFSIHRYLSIKNNYGCISLL